VYQVRPMWPSETEDVVHVVQEQVVVVKEPASYNPRPTLSPPLPYILNNPRDEFVPGVRTPRTCA
jgi:hypothetical protein